MSLFWMQNNSLIAHVRAERALWDTSYSGNREAETRAEAWERVFSRLGFSSLSQSEMNMIIRRWRNLRDTFARKYKYIMKQKGDLAAYRASSRWKHFNSLMFLRDVLEPSRRARTKATKQDVTVVNGIKQECDEPGEECDEPGEGSASQLLLATVSGNAIASPSDTDTPVTHITIHAMPASPSSSSEQGSPCPDNNSFSFREARSPSPAYVLPTSELDSADPPKSDPLSRNAITSRTGHGKLSDADAGPVRNSKQSVAGTTPTEHFLLSLRDHLDEVPEHLTSYCKIHLLDVLSQYRGGRIPTKLLPLPPLSSTEK